MLHGFAKVCMLDNGIPRVGLHRGHVELWSRNEVRSFGGVKGSYTEDYGLYGESFYHTVTEVQFYDMTHPLSPMAFYAGADNRFIAGDRR